jgi:hypothetical protein
MYMFPITAYLMLITMITASSVDPILSQLYPLHTLRPVIKFNIILASMPWSRTLSFPFRYTDYNFVCISRLHMRGACPVTFILPDFTKLRILRPIRVAARFKRWAVFARSNVGIVGSNPTQGMDVCVRLFCLCYSVCRQRPSDGLTTIHGVLPTVYRIKTLKKRPRSNKRV